ncbi:Protein argonaute 1B [Lachnellula suecica]|uniref:Protein argonaute 1B n=1 Tax=Lachnellula suecica TaxID=602035 RepID=A0A8T9CQ71_9HELO|nr:Protein argonaute 1B [Lachnellula suecica]
MNSLPRHDQKTNRKIKRETRRFLVDLYLSKIAPPASRSVWATDYDSTVISVGELYPNSAKTKGHVTDLDDRSQKTQSLRMKASITFLGIVDTQGLQNHVSNKDKSFLDKPEEELNALNIISWKNINGMNFRGGRVGNKFYPEDLVSRDEERVKMGAKHIYLIRHGFFSSMRPGQNSILLNVNTATSAFYAHINLQVWMNRCWSGSHPSDRDFRQKLNGVRVTLNLHAAGPGQDRVWIVRGISGENVYDTTFMKDGKETKVWDYLETHPKYKGYPSGDAKQSKASFCINVGSFSRPIWYPADQLNIVEWQVLGEKVPEHYSEEMVKASEKFPQQSIKDIMKSGLKELGLDSKEDLYKDFGIQRTPEAKSWEMLKLDGIKLPLPKLVFGKANASSQKQALPPKDAQWFLTDRSMSAAGKSCSKLHVLWIFGASEEFTSNIDVDKQTGYLRELLKTLRGQGKDIGCQKMLAHAPKYDPQTKEVSREECLSELTRARSECSDSDESINLLLVVLPGVDRLLYPEVKRWGDCIQGTPTVCVTREKLNMTNGTSGFNLTANICLKINSRLTGVSHILDPKDTGFSDHNKGMTGAYKGTMIVGADVTHPGKGVHRCPSMAVVVATNDEVSSHYLGSARLQEERQEYISDLKGMMAERVKAWYRKANGTIPRPKEVLPKNILFYRDGVSESQYGMVYHEERQQIFDGCEQALAELKKEGNIAKNVKWVQPKLTLIVVGKRHHARFYPFDKILDQPNANLPGGTVVDTDVVTPNHRNFYLQSHHSPKGTARSSHYVVIHDDLDYPMADLEKITHNICYTGSKATKALSVCTPAKYADLLCDRLRCYMKPVLDNFYQPSSNVTGNAGATAGSASQASPPQPGPSQLTITPTTVGDRTGILLYGNDNRIWNGFDVSRERAATQNPWHPRLNDTMFYL